MPIFEYLIRCLECGYTVPGNDAMGPLEMMVHLEAQHGISTGPRESV